jgi:hypothetical protein
LVSSTTALGDWYFKVLFTKPQWLVLGVSERSRLPVVLPARELVTMTVRFQDALERVPEELGVSTSAIAAEHAAMREVTLAKTVDRHVLGSLNDFAHAVEWALHDGGDFAARPQPTPRADADPSAARCPRADDPSVLGIATTSLTTSSGSGDHQPRRSR